MKKNEKHNGLQEFDFWLDCYIPQKLDGTASTEIPGNIFVALMSLFITHQ
jgi:hypothetical protein